MRILIITTEPLPFPGCITTGTGLRAWGLAEGLRGKGFDVEIAVAADAVNTLPAEQQAAHKSCLVEREALTGHVRAHKPDAIVMQHWGMMDRLGEVDCPLAIDLAGPHLLERVFWGSKTPERDLEQKLAALRRADFLTCAGRVQRNYFLPFAIQAGFDPADPGLLPAIPISVSPDLPEEQPHDPATFVYGGTMVPWQDPRPGIEPLLDALESRGVGRLRFIGQPHPAGWVGTGDFERVTERIEASPRASFEAPAPFDAFQQTLSQCGAAVDLMARNVEREIAFTSRTVVYLACGLPVIHDDYSEFSGLLREYDAGWRLDPENPTAVRDLVKRLLDDPNEVERRRENARRLVREKLTWDNTTEPLAAWCASPTLRSGKETSGSDPAELRSQLEEVRRAYREVSGRRLVKLSNLLRRLRLRR